MGKREAVGGGGRKDSRTEGGRRKPGKCRLVWLKRVRQVDVLGAFDERAVRVPQRVGRKNGSKGNHNRHHLFHEYEKFPPKFVTADVSISDLQEEEGCFSIEIRWFGAAVPGIYTSMRFREAKGLEACVM